MMDSPSIISPEQLDELNLLVQLKNQK